MFIFHLIPPSLILLRIFGLLLRTRLSAVLSRLLMIWLLEYEILSSRYLKYELLRICYTKHVDYKIIESSIKFKRKKTIVKIEKKHNTLFEVWILIVNDRFSYPSEAFAYFWFGLFGFLNFILNETVELGEWSKGISNNVKVVQVARNKTRSNFNHSVYGWCLQVHFKNITIKTYKCTNFRALIRNKWRQTYNAYHKLVCQTPLENQYQRSTNDSTRFAVQLIIWIDHRWRYCWDISPQWRENLSCAVWLWHCILYLVLYDCFLPT